MLKLKNINKTFIKKGQSIKALDNVSLEIQQGDIFGIIGFSGAGKSTLVRCMNLLETPDEGGQVIFDNTDLTALKDKQLRAYRSKIGMIFQHFNLMPSRTVLDNVLYPLAYKGIEKEQRYAKARKLLDLVGLKDFEKSYPRELSGGQKQRVAIARALACDPKVLLCDEATSALDPKTTAEILKLLYDLNVKLNLTIVIITHEMDVVKDICNRVAIMEQGRLVETGEVFDVFSNPKSAVSLNFVRSASNLSKIDELIDKDNSLFNLSEDEIVVRLSYVGRGTSEPLISTISHKFNLIMNILYADIELIHGAPIGGTVGVLKGRREDLQAAVEFISQKNVKVEILKDGKLN
ncbi:Methionine import ATP-binding protein MetN [Anaerobiospirillum thomasii]|uniref:Cell division ATP-binding protein FtsE n=1 Tax=Anaerobiospirillum thomasii TaxID=179995 RepID=A0A2X0V267_9GAMM|nr:ATP-binding cassette domain-containing protein [Anaerobiospirillum thomasii]SPT68507.1 Methionine import ATP-binding protein MetN [Anaerobiospirillum thomasii]SPT68629.1 Methionine import ATP-binding protein MetN [Anaerobiospirillum thomasii]